MQEAIQPEREKDALNEEAKITNLPLVKTKGILGLFKKNEFTEPIKGQHEKPKEPLLILVRDTMNAQIIEGMQAGKIKITRSDQKTGSIDLPKERMQTAKWANDMKKNPETNKWEIDIERRKEINAEWGSNQIRFWIAYENEAFALPTNTEHDSAARYNEVSSLIANMRNLEAETVNAYSDAVVKIVIGIAILAIIVIVILPMLGIHILDPQTTTNTANTANQAINPQNVP